MTPIILMKNKTVGIDNSRIEEIKTAKGASLVLHPDQVSEETIKLMSLLNVSFSDIMTPHPIHKDKLAIIAYSEKITINDLEKEYNFFSQTITQLMKLKAKGFNLSISAKKFIEKGKKLNHNLNELKQIINIENNMAGFNNGMGYNNATACLFFKDRKDNLFGNISVGDGPNGPEIIKYGRNITINKKMDANELTINQKKCLIFEMAWVDDMKKEALSKTTL